MSLISEFKDFAMRGNVVDMAVGIVIGGAFGKIVSSFVSNVIMPPLNLITAKYGVNFNELALRVPTEAPEIDEAGKPVLDAAGNFVMSQQDYAILNYGPLLQTIVDFLLIAAAIFLAIRVMNKLTAKQEDKAEEVKEPSEDVLLLREIRDSLSNKQ